MRRLFLMLITWFALTACVGMTEREIERATRLHEQAVTLHQQGKYREEITLLQSALEISEKVLGPEHPFIAPSLNDLALLYIRISQYEKALPLFQRAVAINEKTIGLEYPNTIASINKLAEPWPNSALVDALMPNAISSIINLAKLYSALGQQDKSLLQSKYALAVTEKYYGPEHTNTAGILDHLADLYVTFSQYDKALPLYERALAINEKIFGPEDTHTAVSLNNLAFLYSSIDQFDKALPLFERALLINEKAFGPEDAHTAVSLGNLALLYSSIDQFDKALVLCQRALAIREKGSDDDATITSLNNLGMLYVALNQYDKAMPLLQRAVAISEKFYSPENPITSVSINNLAVLYEEIGQYDKALSLFQRASAICEEFPGTPQSVIAKNLNNLAVLHSDLGQYDQAMPLSQRALEISENVLGPEALQTGWYLERLAQLYVFLGQYDKALPLYQRALAIFEKIQGPEYASTAFGLNKLGELYEYLGQHDKALPMLQRAYRTALHARVPRLLKDVQGNLGSFYANQDNPATAIFYLKGAVNTMQSIRTESRGLDKTLQRTLVKKHEDVYNKLADLLVDAGRLAEAQQVLSMLKEQEYFDFIRRDAQADTRSTRMNYSGTERAYAERLDKLGQDGSALVDKLNVLNNQAKLGLTSEQKKQRAQIQEQLDEHTKQTIALLNEIPQRLHAAQQRAGPVQLADVAKENLALLRATLTSLGHGAVLLQYLVTDTRVLIILTTPQVLLAREAHIPAKVLNRKIAEFRRVLQNPARDPRLLAQEMYQLLIAPVANDLKQFNAKTLMLSLDGSLRYLPLGALHDGEAYLAERYSLAMYTDVAKDKLREKPVALWKVAGLGLTRKIGEFAPLPSVRQELDGIIHAGSRKATGGVLPGDIYLDEDFTQTRLHDVLDRVYPVLHIASHFVFIPGTEAQSFLLLGDGTQLSLAEMRTGGWKFNTVDVMTLSACETALGGGRDETGREIEGFGALAQRQGAKSVLATLWPVADQSTAILMQSFYHLRQEKGLTKADALREAQVTLISGKHARPLVLRKSPIVSGAEAGTANAPAYTPDPARPYAHPYYWAPFILMGNWL